MVKYVKLIQLIFIVPLLVGSFGCTDRGTNVPDLELSKGGLYTAQHDFTREFYLQIGRNDSRGTRIPMQLRGYIPPSSIVPVQGGKPDPVPMLILLPPQDGDEWFFINHGLLELADQLIAEGVIQPMVIVCISNDKFLAGGYFYAGDSPGAGFYDEFVGRALVDWLYDFGVRDYVNRALPLGIGGVGMGGYGALRAVILNPGVFSSVSVTDGPLDFDGPDGQSGFIELFSKALEEQNILGDSLWREKFGNNKDWRLSRLFIGGALAFSPHDTLIDTTGIVELRNDSTEWRIIIPDSQRFVIDDSMTLITEVVKHEFLDFDFHLPFDSNGAPYQLIWDMWLDNNLEALLLQQGFSVLSGVNMWYGTSPEYQFANYRQQTLSWIDWLRSSPIDQSKIQVKEYTGYAGNPATDDQYVYDILRDMLIFHSRVFEQQMQK
jgi:hypothetical protein